MLCDRVLLLLFIKIIKYHAEIKKVRIDWKMEDERLGITINRLVRKLLDNFYQSSLLYEKKRGVQVDLDLKTIRI